MEVSFCLDKSLQINFEGSTQVHILLFSKINGISSEDEEEDDESEEEAEEDVILSASKISSSHEVNHYTSFELKDENNITFVHILLKAPKLIDDISTSVPI